MTDHETVAGVGERVLLRADWERDHDLGHPSLIDCDGAALGPGEVCARLTPDAGNPSNRDWTCPGCGWHTRDVLWENHVCPTPAASTDPAPEGGLREAIEALAARWKSDADTVHRGMTALVDRQHADELRALLAAHPAPETPEQVQGGGEGCDRRGPGGECVRDHEPCPDFPPASTDAGGALSEADLHVECGQPWTVHEDDGVQMLCPEAPDRSYADVETLRTLLDNATAYTQPGRGLVTLNTARAEAVLSSEWLLARESAAATRARAEGEQAGREDNADHGMCYVHGSKALAARDAEMRAEGAAGDLLGTLDLRNEGAAMVRARLLDSADRLGNPDHPGNQWAWPDNAEMLRSLARAIADDHIDPELPIEEKSA